MKTKGVLSLMFLIFFATAGGRAQGVHNVTKDIYYLKIQEAIDAASAGDVIEIAAGSYYEKATSRAHCGSGSDQFGLYIGTDNLTLRGLKANGQPVANAGEVAVNITTEALNDWGVSGIFVEGSGVTIQGVKLGDNYVLPGHPILTEGGIYNEKALEVAGNGFTFDKCQLVMSTTATPGVYSDEGQIYIGEMCHEITTYAITSCIFQNANISVNNGAGDTGDRSGRVITGNTFNGKATPYLVGFTGWTGANPPIGWITLPVGGAVITGNTFSNGTTIMNYIMAYGNEGGYLNSQMDWQEMFSSNTFPKVVATLSDEPSFAVRSFSEGAGGYTAIRMLGPTIQAGIDQAVAGDVVKVSAGTFSEQVNLNKAVTIHGAGTSTVVNGTSAGSVIVVAANDAAIKNIKIDNANALDGICVNSDITGLAVRTCTLSNNARYGINFVSPGAGNVLAGNTFEGAAVTGALKNGGAVTVTANSNYWGSSKGPALAANPCGDGKVIDGPATYNPWSNAAFDKDVFQLQDFTVSGNATVCNWESTSVTTSGSQILQAGSDYAYKLYKNAVFVTGSTLSGTGSGLSWTVQPADGDIYTVKVASVINGCELTLSGSAVMTVNQPVPFDPPTVASLQATGSNIKWYAASTGGTSLASTTALTNGTTYYASQTVDGVESLTRLAVVAQVDPTPCAPTGNATQNFSAGQTVASLTATGNQVRWYSAASGGVPLASTTLLVSGDYYATQTKQCIESGTRFKVTVTVN